MQETTPGLVQ